ncbi:hypothetical protein FAI40_01605 [Acetobacteraceae bacterium]|nr:hypothetical protein FAI40_01605 [Acetobacteraceae bacterium]
MKLPVNIVLFVSGKQISGWEQASIHLGIDLMPWAASLQISFPDLLGYEQDFPEIYEGDDAVLLVNGSVLITGRLLQIEEEISSEQHVFTFEIASKTLDLTDCSAEIPKNQMNSTDLYQISKQICENFNIQVLKGEALPSLDIQAYSSVLTETPFQIMDKLCRLAGILFVDTPEGNVLLTNVGQEKMGSSLVLGGNVEKLRRKRSISGRYHEIRAIVNNEVILNVPPSENKNYVSQIESLTLCTPAIDEGVPATRKLLVPVETNDPDFKVTQKRVDWEISRRFGRSCASTVTVDSWLDDFGSPWLPNKLVALQTKISTEEYLIVEVEFTKDLQGTRANLTLMPKEAFIPQPMINPLYNSKLTQALM